MTWIGGIMHATQDLESPRDFFYWSALAAISAVVKRNVYLDRGGAFKTYPNIYVMLVADSGMRKSIPVNMAQKLVTSVGNTRIIAGRNSIEGILRDLSVAFARENGKPITTACGFLVSKEFATLLLRSPEAFTLLTDLYDTDNHDEWKNTLKHSSVETLKEPYITILGASNEDQLNDVLPLSTLKGGFMGRVFVVRSNDKGKPNPLLRPQDHVLNINEHVPYLREISNAEGPFRFEDEATLKYAENWYENNFGRRHNDVTGFANRLQTHILKIAMLVSLSRSLNLVLTKEDFDDAVDACELFTVNAKRVTEGVGKGEIGWAIKIVMDELLKAPGYKISKRKILRNHYGNIDAAVLTRIIEHLGQAKLIERHFVDNDDWYELTKETVAEYEAATVEERKKRRAK